MKHPHDELIRDWLDGASIQYQTATGMWADMPGVADADKLPHFYRDEVYRRKPRAVRVRVALTSTGVALADSVLAETLTAKRADFVRWLTDWLEYTA